MEHIFFWLSTHAQLLSSVWLCDPMTVDCQAPLAMGFYRQEYWSGLPFLSPGDLSDPEIEPASSVSPTADRFFTTEPPGKLHFYLVAGKEDEKSFVVIS